MNSKKKRDTLSEKKTLVVDNKAFKALFDAYGEKLFVYVNGFTNDYFLSQDIVQDTFVKLWKNREKLHFNKSIVGYLYKTAYNTFCDSHRKQRQEFKMLDDLAYKRANELLEEEESVKAARIAQIKSAIETLPPKTMQVFKMSKFQGYKYQEIADELGVSVKTVEAQMGRAFSLIRAQIKDNDTFLLFLNIFWK